MNWVNRKIIKKEEGPGKQECILPSLPVFILGMHLTDCLFFPIFEILFKIPLSWETHHEPYLEFSVLFAQSQLVPDFKSDNGSNAQVHLDLPSLIMKGREFLWQCLDMSGRAQKRKD